MPENEGKIQEAIEQGVSPEDMGLDVTNLEYHMPDEVTVADKKGTNTPEYQQRNEEPVPPGTPDGIAKMFRAIPHGKIQEIKKVYARFEHKDMTFCDFAVEYAWLTSPAAASHELESIVERMSTGAARKDAIDSLLRPD